MDQATELLKWAASRAASLWLGPQVLGSAVAVLVVLVVAVRARLGPGEWTRPLRLVQVLFCQIYLFAGWSKLFTTGWSWASAENVRGHLLALNQALVAPPASSLGYAVARHPLACGALAWAGLVLEIAFPLVLFSATARWILLPAAAVFHAANSVLFRIFFQNAPLLLLFVDWDAALRRLRGVR